MKNNENVNETSLKYYNIRLFALAIFYAFFVVIVISILAKYKTKLIIQKERLNLVPKLRLGRYEIQNHDNRVQICALYGQVHIHLWFQDEEKQGSPCQQVENL